MTERKCGWLHCRKKGIQELSENLKRLRVSEDANKCNTQDFGQVSMILYFQMQTLIQKLSFEGWGVQVHISGFWPGVPDLPFPNTNSNSKGLLWRLRSPVPFPNTKSQKLGFVNVLKAEEFRCTFQDFGQVSQILHFQIQILIQKLSFEGWRIQVHISGFWPGVPDPPFPNANSYSKA